MINELAGSPTWSENAYFANNKKVYLAQVFSYEFCETSNNTFFYRTPQVAASKIIVFQKIRNSLTNFLLQFLDSNFAIQTRVKALRLITIMLIEEYCVIISFWFFYRCYEFEQVNSGWLILCALNCKGESIWNERCWIPSVAAF